MAGENGHRFGMMINTNAEGCGHGIGGNIVMGRPDPTGSKDIVELGSESIYRSNNLRLDIRHNPGFPELDADLSQASGHPGHVLVLRSPGEDFIAD